jgi:rsbT co-antagonist protein RsbR
LEPYIVDVILKNRSYIIDQWLEEVKVNLSARLFTHSDEVFKNTNREFIEIVLTNLNKSQDVLNERITVFSDQLIKMGWALSFVTEGLQMFRKVILELLFEQFKADNISIVTAVDSWIDPIINQVVDDYSGSWENTVSLQRIALQELSAPLIPVIDKISIMPLIGTIDTERAKLIMENLLNGVIKHRSEVVLIDITGVPVVDTMVAHHIIQAAEAVRLVGAQCILVGIRPEIAQTIVNLGIDLSKFPTKNTLKKGLESALNLTNRNIVELN